MKKITAFFAKKVDSLKELFYQKKKLFKKKVRKWKFQLADFPLKTLLKIIYFKLYYRKTIILRDYFREKEIILSSKRKREIEEIRFTNIYTTLFTNAGAVFALLLTYFSVIFSLSFVIKDMIPMNPLVIDCIKICLPTAQEHPLIYFSSALILSYVFLLLTTPYLLRKILDHLSPDDYASMSIINLNKSELLTFNAYKNWLLIQEFIEIYENFNINKVEKDKKSKPKIREFISELERFEREKYAEIQQCIALVKKSAEKLGINKRELVNHILEFSPALFELNLNKSIDALKTYFYLIEQRNPDDLDNLVEQPNTDYNIDIYHKYVDSFDCHVKELKNERLKYLEQILVFGDKLNEYLIGISSNISTSLSLKVFLRGLSEIANFKELAEIEKDEMLKALYNRSKAHCGVDLKIPYKNFVEHSDSTLLSKVNLFSVEQLQNVRSEFTRYENKAREKIIDKINSRLNEIIIDSKSNYGNTYMIIFGFSDVLRKCLKENAFVLKENKIKIFVFLENNVKSLDTRSFRYELKRNTIMQEEYKVNDKESDIVHSFTAQDTIIKNLLKPNDKVIFLAGIEIFSADDKLLFHTNNYQERVEKLWKFLNKKKDTQINKEIWLVGESYKVYKKFPNVEMSEFYDDHYSTLDLYSLNNYFKEGLDKDIFLISDKNNSIFCNQETIFNRT